MLMQIVPWLSPLPTSPSDILKQTIMPPKNIDRNDGKILIHHSGGALRAVRVEEHEFASLEKWVRGSSLPNLQSLFSKYPPKWDYPPVWLVSTTECLT